ncbi:MAG: hypothetical protein LQ352_001819 [Teloschistes flavicans]|nr:MAG: hypothetical protein LQ352_001819 [Teloschistes flavicans]
MATDDGSEDVNEFLLRIRELGDQRDREDEERTRKLEEEILQGRKERQARRAERARSISPTKDTASTVGTPSPTPSTVDSMRQDRLKRSPVTFEPLQRSLDEATAKTPYIAGNEPHKSMQLPPPRDLPQPPAKSSVLPDTSPSAAMPLSRAGTLSWQQRPTSRDSTGPRARPLSQVAAENNAFRSPRGSEEPPSRTEREKSRDQIAESLASKDPTWFRQTQERGIGSAAFRRNQEETNSDTISMTGSMRLPGMSRGSTMEPERQRSPDSESLRSFSPLRADSIRSDPIRPFKPSNSTSLSSSNSVRSPLPIMNSQILESPAPKLSPPREHEAQSSRDVTTSPSQGWISPERMGRPPSPTKGLGGFVQSAMLKRSDSVSKRWSAQPGTGLSRGNSIASNRSGFEGPIYGTSNLYAPRDQAPVSSSRETSPVATSRPGSSHSTAPLTGGDKANSMSLSPVAKENARTLPPSENEPLKPAAGHKTSPLNLSSHDSSPPDNVRGENDRPSSPSKKWSPSKSSWLENAINKPDSPKPKMPPPQQPSWMANINQAKQQRGSVDPGKGSTFKEVSTTGFLRSPPTGTVNNPAGLGGLRIGPNDETSRTSRTENLERNMAPKTEQMSESPEPNSEAALRHETASVTEPAPLQPTVTTSTSSKPSPRSPSAQVDQTKKVSPRPTKLKPETPPKKDFRSNLKPRQASAGKQPNEDAEFRNVFGKLKRTQTQNYVAPDELKENILRGKAGLAISGGPKKTERRDEFKESLLKQKEAMKAGTPPIVGRKPSTSDTPNKQKMSIPGALPSPESLTKQKSRPFTNTPIAAIGKQQPEALAQLKRLKERSQPTSIALPFTQSENSQSTPPAKAQKGNDFNASLAGVLARGPSSLAGGPSTAPRLISERHDAETEVHTPNTVSEKVAEGSQLTHMAKSRARGPKRRLPTTSDAKELPNTSETSPSSDSISVVKSTKVRSQLEPSLENPSTDNPSQQARPVGGVSNDHRKLSQPQPPRKPSTTIHKLEILSPPLQPGQTIKPETTSIHPTSPPATAPKPLNPNIDRSRRLEASVPSSRKSPSDTFSDQPLNNKPVDVSLEPISRRQPPPLEETPPSSVRGAAAIWGRSEASVHAPRLRASSPIRLPNRKDEEAAMEDAGLARLGNVVNGLGITNMRHDPQIYGQPKHDLPTPPLSSPKSPPLPGQKPPSLINRGVSDTTASESVSNANGSPIPQASETTRLFAELFDESPKADLNVKIDTPTVLASRTSTLEAEKIRTLRKQIWEVTAGGKLIPVPSDQGHILFEESLYICHHVFGSLAGTRTTEVYLWCGDGVATSAVEDAQIFARKEAKDHGGKLIVLSQGKETARFFQALGGIVITRLGQSDRASSRYMLCGRRHVGHIVFDEMEFSPRSLCKGFPYIIAAGSSKVHIWKGSGAGVDELGCARLIGMDLGLGGEIQELEDGHEPDSFWKLFPSGQQQRAPADGESPVSRHWQLKPSCEKYATRLYQVDIEAPRPKSSGGFKWGRRGSAPATEDTSAFTAVIREIVPFAQTDMFHDGVFVLDVFFEIFVILPSFPSTSTLRPTFRTALLFAQEYAILAASNHEENRPFVPSCSVVLLGVGRDKVPEGLRWGFRKWDEGKVRGCKVLGLVESIEGTQGG